MKKCFKCQGTKPISDFYRHPMTKDGHLGKCKACAKNDASRRTISRACEICNHEFMTWPHEIKRGGGKTCSRVCYYKRLDKLLVNKFPIKQNYSSLHKWVYKHLGKASSCEMCNVAVAPAFHWSNKSGEYAQDLSDWWSLCAKCHHKYDSISAKAWATRKKLYANGFKSSINLVN